MDLNTLTKRVDDLLAITGRTMGDRASLFNGTLSVMHGLYGPASAQENSLRSLVESIGGDTPVHAHRVSMQIDAIKGVLTSIKSELAAGFVGSLRAMIAGEVLGDLIKLAHKTLEETSDDAKNVACVLIAAAFEDTVRKLADLSGLPSQEKLADVLTQLKEKEILKGAQVAIAQSCLQFRNRALHAKWAEVERASAQGVLSFTEGLLTLHFA